MEIERRDIEWYEDYYQVSNTWLVRSLTRVVVRSDWKKHTYKWGIKKIYKGLRKNKVTSQTVILSMEWIDRTFSLARIVASTFIRPLLEEELVNHIDWNLRNNHVNNLCINKDQSFLTNKLINNNILTAEKKVSQYSLSWEYIKTFNSIVEANIYFGKRKYSISITRNLKLERKSAYWYIRKYAE